jgi:Ca2+-dependent lipid-binding protein
VELKGLIGTVRLRIQMNPQPPFIKNVTFTLMGLPQIQVSAIPMTERGINVLNLPLISGFVNNSIAAAANEYVAPKSMSLDVGKMLVGDDIKKGITIERVSDCQDTDAVGVLFVKIHRAVGLSAQDRNGGSDCYITLAYSKYGKPMYSTRVIINDLNPIWEESTW